MKIKDTAKMMEILMLKPYGYITYNEMAEFLIQQGARVPTLCENCECGLPEDLKDDRVWCSRMCRYMSKIGYCSEGEPKK